MFCFLFIVAPSPLVAFVGKESQCCLTFWLYLLFERRGNVIWGQNVSKVKILLTCFTWNNCMYSISDHIARHVGYLRLLQYDKESQSTVIVFFLVGFLTTIVLVLNLKASCCY